MHTYVHAHTHAHTHKTVSLCKAEMCAFSKQKKERAAPIMQLLLPSPMVE